MLRKTVFSLCFLFAGASPLFAVTKGSFILYPQAGLGASSAFCSTWSGDRLSEDVTNSPGAFKDTVIPAPGYSLSIGCGIDYLFTDSLAITGGLFIDGTSFSVIYTAKTALPNKEFIYSFTYFSIPAGLRFYGEIFIFGGGLYIDAPLASKLSVKYGGVTQKDDDFKNRTTAGIFLDIGVYNQLKEENSLMVFCRLKNDVTSAYKGKKEEEAVTNIKRISFNITIAYGFILN